MRRSSLRVCFPLLAAIALLLPAGLSLAQDGDETAPVAADTAPAETAPTAATTTPVAQPPKVAGTDIADPWDPEKTAKYDTDKQYVYFGLNPDPEDNVDRDIFRIELPAEGQAVPEDQYQRITAHYGVDSFARISNDGQWAVYTSDRERFQDATNPFYWDFELYLKNLKSGELKRLTYTFNDRELAPSVSDDGTRVVFMADKFARTNMSLYWIDVAKPYERHLLSNNADKKTFALISPDGQYVYFNEMDGPATDPKSTYDIFRIHLDTLKKENMTNTKGISELHVDISADGKKIVYERHKRLPAADLPKDLKPNDPNHPNQLFEIYMLETDTRRLTQVTNNDVGDGFPSISADGTIVVFQSARRNLDDQPGEEFELFAIKVGSKTEWQISSRKQSHDFVCTGF